MSVIIGGVYETQSGAFLRLVSQSDLLFNFILVTKENQPIPEQRNKKGVVVVRSHRSYSEEVFLSFKKVK